MKLSCQVFSVLCVQRETLSLMENNWAEAAMTC